MHDNLVNSTHIILWEVNKPDFHRDLKLKVVLVLYKERPEDRRVRKLPFSPAELIFKNKEIFTHLEDGNSLRVIA